MTLYVLADYLSSYINDVFCLLLLWERRGQPVALAFWLRAVVTLVIAVGLAEVCKAIPIVGILPRGGGGGHCPNG